MAQFAFKFEWFLHSSSRDDSLQKKLLERLGKNKILSTKQLLYILWYKKQKKMEWPKRQKIINSKRSLLPYGIAEYKLANLHV